MSDKANKSVEKRQLRVAAYIRVSTEDQAQKFGPEMQRSAIDLYVKSRGQLDDGREAMLIPGAEHIYEDDGISGTTDIRERPAFAQLMEDIENAPKDRKPFDVVAVYKVDRFARKLKILLQIIDFFSDHDIQFISVNESIDTSTPFGRAILGIMGVIAELEIETTKIRTQDGRRSSFNKGTFLSIAPFGYSKDAAKRLIVLSEESEIVKQIFNWFVFENMSTQDIATKLTLEKVLSPDASAIKHNKRKGSLHKIHGQTFWRADRVRDFLKDDVYMGYYYGGKTKDKKDIPKENWILSDFRHEPIIEPSIFVKSQERLKASAEKTISRRKDERQYLLRGLLRCGYCRTNESKMLAWHGLEKKKQGQLSYFYKCGGKTSAKHAHICTTLPLPGDQIEEYVVSFVRSLLDKPQATYQYQLNLQSTKVKIKLLKEERERLRIALNTIHNRRYQLSEQHEMGIINRDQLDERMKKVDSDEQEMNKRMGEIDRIIGQHLLSEGYTKSFEEFSAKYRKALDDAFNNFNDVYVLLHSLIDKIIIYSRPVNHEFDKIAGMKKEGQQIPYEIKIELKLPQQVIADLVERKFAPKTGTPHIVYLECVLFG